MSVGLNLANLVVEKNGLRPDISRAEHGRHEEKTSTVKDRLDSPGGPVGSEVLAELPTYAATAGAFAELPKPASVADGSGKSLWEKLRSRLLGHLEQKHVPKKTLIQFDSITAQAHEFLDERSKKKLRDLLDILLSAESPRNKREHGESVHRVLEDLNEFLMRESFRALPPLSQNSFLLAIKLRGFELVTAQSLKAIDKIMAHPRFSLLPKDAQANLFHGLGEHWEIDDLVTILNASPVLWPTVAALLGGSWMGIKPTVVIAQLDQLLGYELMSKQLKESFRTRLDPASSRFEDDMTFFSQIVQRHGAKSILDDDPYLQAALLSEFARVPLSNSAVEDLFELKPNLYRAKVERVGRPLGIMYRFAGGTRRQRALKSAFRHEFLIDGEVFYIIEARGRTATPTVESLIQDIAKLPPSIRRVLGGIDLHWDENIEATHADGGIYSTVTLGSVFSRANDAARLVHLMHEAGHVWLSKSGLWFETYYEWFQEKERDAPFYAAWKEAIEKDVLLVSQYAAENAREDLAETFALYLLVCGTPQEERMRVLFENRFALLDSKLSQTPRVKGLILKGSASASGVSNGS